VRRTLRSDRYRRAVIRYVLLCRSSKRGRRTAVPARPARFFVGRQEPSGGGRVAPSEAEREAIMTPENQVRRKHRPDEVGAGKVRGQLEPGHPARLARAGATRRPGARAANEQERVAPAPEGRDIRMRAGTSSHWPCSHVAGAVAFAYFGLSEPDRPMPSQFFVALILGSLLTLGVPPRLLPPSK
jgi:hypothetical protein